MKLEVEIAFETFLGPDVATEDDVNAVVKSLPSGATDEQIYDAVLLYIEENAL